LLDYLFGRIVSALGSRSYLTIRVESGEILRREVLVVVVVAPHVFFPRIICALIVIFFELSLFQVADVLLA
jgi:hypothetical protein